jgi:hypothetical protein
MNQRDVRAAEGIPERVELVQAGVVSSATRSLSLAASPWRGSPNAIRRGVSCRQPRRGTLVAFPVLRIPTERAPPPDGLVRCKPVPLGSDRDANQILQECWLAAPRVFGPSSAVYITTSPTQAVFRRVYVPNTISENLVGSASRGSKCDAIDASDYYFGLWRREAGRGKTLLAPSGTVPMPRLFDAQGVWTDVMVDVPIRTPTILRSPAPQA